MNKDNNKTTTYILDTTAVIEDPEIMYKKAKGEFVIPQVVIREIDGLKKSDKLNVAQAARTLSRDLDRMSEYADLKAGVQLSTGGILRVYPEFETINDLDSDADNKIVGAAIRLKKEGKNVVLVSTDTNLRVVAKLHGIKTRYSLPYDITIEEMKQAETIAAKRRAEQTRTPVNTITSRSIFQRWGISGILLRLCILVAAFGFAIDLLMPQYYGVKLNTTTGIALLTGIVAMAYRTHPSLCGDSKRGYDPNLDVVTSPAFSSLTCNVWHRNDED